MEQAGMFQDTVQNQMLSSMLGFLNIFKIIVLAMGLMLFLKSITDMLMEQQSNITELMKNFIISVIMIGIGVSESDMILKINQNSQPTVVEAKVEKEKELSREKKLKRLNAYRKSNHKNILLADASVVDQYLNYLKGKNLDEVALKY